MRKITRTVYGAALQTAINYDRPYTIVENSTLNQKFEIHANQLPTESDHLATGYYCIGNGGHRAVTGADGITSIRHHQHQPTDAACFRHLPFVLRQVDNDLTIEQRANYALRRIETHNGQQYVAYYAKRLALDNMTVGMWRTSVSGGVENTIPFVPTASNLSPQPAQLLGDDESSVLTASGDYVSGSGVVTINFTEQDAAELREVARVLYGDERYAVISELAVVSGIDRTLTGPGPGNSNVSYNEAIAAQITTHIAVYYQMDVSNDGFTYVADVGITEPLFIAQPTP